MPFSVHQEVSRLLEEMQENGVIQPSESPCMGKSYCACQEEGRQPPILRGLQKT